jgi:vacuolar-type H+-ATPase subunit F/Vma7
MSDFVYIGQVGAGLGFALAGVLVLETENSEKMLEHLKEIRETAKVVFLDEGLAGDVLDEVERLNTEPLPAIVLLPKPGKQGDEESATSERMKRLMIQAVGSDIFS